LADNLNEKTGGFSCLVSNKTSLTNHLVKQTFGGQQALAAVKRKKCGWR
jgi:hypothetical protein